MKPTVSIRARVSNHLNPRSCPPSVSKLAARFTPLRIGMLTCCAWLASSLVGPSNAYAQDIPTPESVLGHKVGADFFLATYDESLDYFQKLDAASDRILLRRVGETSFGADWHIALISAPENLRNLDTYIEVARRLAWAKGLDDQTARRLARDGKAVVHIDGGLHATEAAGAQHTIQLAYDLVSTNGDPGIDRILDEVILILWFSINPDGQNLIANWYRQNLGTPFEVTSPPQLYQKYVGHDNNRDGYMNNMLESKVVTRTTLELSPQVFYNHHQTAPFPARIWIPPFAEPVSSNVHPLMWRWVNVFGTSMAAYLDQRGMPGSIHRGRGFDDWYPGFIDHVNSFRNTISFLTETALYRLATPRFYTLQDFPRNRQDLRSEVFYASPWKGGWWRLGDAVDYMIGASMAVLDTAARHRESILYNRYQAGRDTIEMFTKDPPYAYIIPTQQRDPQTAAELARVLQTNGIQVHRATEAFNANGQQYQAGSWVILMDQAYARLVKELLEVQVYPDLRDFPDGPPDQPYDVAGWTLPMQMGVTTAEIVKPLSAELRAKFEAVDEIESPPGRVQGTGNYYVFSHQPNVSIKAVHDVLRAGGEVSFAAEPMTTSRGSEHGAVIVSGLDRAKMGEIAGERRIEVRAESRVPKDRLKVKMPRVGMIRPWSSSIDEGWTRWLFENYEVNLTSLYNEEVRAGHLRDRYDVIVIPDIGGRSILNGRRPGSMPGRYTGGIGDQGAENLREFVRQGGTMVTWNGGSNFVISNFNLPIKNALSGLRNTEFFCSGSLLKIKLADPTHPVVMGMPDEPIVMFQRGPAFETEEGFEGKVLASYLKDRNPLMSGYLLGPDKIQGKGALIDAEYGDGHIILFGFKPQWRGQPHGTFKMIFNALFYSGDMPGAGALPE